MHDLTWRHAHAACTAWHVLPSAAPQLLPSSAADGRAHSLHVIPASGVSIYAAVPDHALMMGQYLMIINNAAMQSSASRHVELALSICESVQGTDFSSIWMKLAAGGAYEWHATRHECMQAQRQCMHVKYLAVGAVHKQTILKLCAPCNGLQNTMLHARTCPDTKAAPEGREQSASEASQSSREGTWQACRPCAPQGL